MNCPKCKCEIKGEKIVLTSYLCVDCYYSLPVIREALKQEWNDICNESHK